MRFLLFIVLLLTPSFAGAWFDTDWNYRVELEVVPSKVGTTTPITSFPVYLNLADLPSGFHTNVKEDGCDIRIVESDDTTETAFELVSYATSTDTGELYFKADTLATSTASSTFYIYYGNSSGSCYAVTDPFGRNEVWTGYRAVYHLNDLTDSTGNGYTLTNNNTVTLNATGQLGGSADFTSGNTNKSLSVASALGAAGTSYTVTNWAYKYSVTTYGQGPWTWNNNTNVTRPYTYYENSGGASIRFAHERTNVSSVQINPLTGWSNSTWHRMTQTYDNSAMRGYLDGVYKNQASITGSGSGSITSTFRIGSHQSGTAVASLFWQGRIDEMRVSTSTYSNSWETTEYNNQSSASTFYWLGAEESNAGGGGGVVEDIIWFF